MTFLAQFLVSVFSGFFTWLTQWFTKKTAITIAMVAAVSTITATFYAGVQALLGGIAASITNADFLMVWWSIWPTNGAGCLTACFGADVAAFLWRYQKRTIETVASA